MSDVIFNGKQKSERGAEDVLAQLGGARQSRPACVARLQMLLVVPSGCCVSLLSYSYYDLK